MARIVSLDVTSEFGSLALVRGGEVIEEILLQSRDGFAHVLYDHLGRMMERHGWPLAEADCFAAASGPGSFTGVRVGLSAVKGLGEALGKPVAGISNLQALAFFGTLPARAVLSDARRGEVYGAVYGAGLEIIVPETVRKFGDWLATLPEGEIEFLSPDFTPFQPALAGTRFEQSRVTTTPRALAGAVGRIAERLYESGKAVDPAALDANYVRRSDAELKWSEPG